MRIIITTWSTGTFALAPTLAGTEELRGGGGRLGAARFLVEAVLWRGGRGSLSSTEKSTRLGYILLVGDRVLSMAPSAGDGNLITYPQCESSPRPGIHPAVRRSVLYLGISRCASNREKRAAQHGHCFLRVERATIVVLSIIKVRWQVPNVTVTALNTRSISTSTSTNMAAIITTAASIRRRGAEARGKGGKRTLPKSGWTRENCKLLW